MRQNRGALVGLIAAALFGASTPAAKALLGAASPQLVAGLLYLGSGVGLAVVRSLARARVDEAPLRRADWRWLIGAIVTGGILAPVLLVNGLAATQAANASLLLNLEGVATGLIAWLIFREHTSRRMIVGTGLIVLGALALSWHGAGSFGDLRGSLLIVAACVCWAIDNNLTRNISSADPYTSATIKGLTSGVVNTSIGIFLLHDVMPQPSIVGLTAVVGFFGYGLSLVCFVLALRHVGTARTGAYFSTAPFVGAAISVAFSQSPFDWRLAFAGAMMAFGTYLHVSERHDHIHAHTVLDHEHAHVHDEHHRHAHEEGTPLLEPHSHPHAHAPLVHEHAHYPDAHHRHDH